MSVTDLLAQTELLITQLQRDLQRARADAITEKSYCRSLTEKANNLARLVEQIAYAPVAGYYESKNNDAPLRLLRLAVEDVDKLTAKGGAR